ncbi:adenylyl-sulfate kinase [Butyrivibrio sp. AD3002]|uniref:adenylyl-sulfate kinase n=1 Tax=Butyrivibrio sp. AD3002 TaxID=1280670 RepID=UPI0003B3F8BE|nr:adenylyl-sulfate kinase [Butyrivibrio sp. AD3002]
MRDYRVQTWYTEEHGIEGRVFWITGLSGAGKTTIGSKLYEYLAEKKTNVIRLDLNAYADQEVEETSDPILFDSICDFRDIWPEISVRKYSYIYFVLNDLVAEKYFYSFMLVPHISEKLGDNLRLFDSPEEFKNYLKQTGNPAPKTIKSESGFNYDEFFKAL